jgi:ComEC/Rec2-related protein
MKLLYICAALALGEYLASRCPLACSLWPFFLCGAALTALYSYGLNMKFGRTFAVALLGAGLYFYSLAPQAEVLRLSPWRHHARNYYSKGKAANPVKNEISRRIGIGLEHSSQTAQINRAILLGERRTLDPSLKKVFVDAGTVHVFAVSGLHVMVIAKILVVFMMMFFVSQRFAGLLALFPLWWYVSIIDFPPSAVRAAFMASINFLAPVFWRKSDMLRSWAITFLVVHLFSPRLISDIGCNLSFVVMLALILATRSALTFRMRVFDAFFFSAAAWAAGAPIAANVFGRVTPGGVVANILLLPAAGVSVCAGFLGVVFSSVSDFLSAHFNNIAALSTKLMAGVSYAVLSLPYASFETFRWHPLFCVLWYFLLLAFLLYFGRRRLITNIP